MFSSNSDTDHKYIGAEKSFVFHNEKQERASIASFPDPRPDVTDMVLDETSDFYWG